jgi:hypothetical protein
MSDASLPPSGRPSGGRLVLGFVAGFIAVLVFHQGMVAFLHAFDYLKAGPFQMQPTWPLGIAKFWSLAFWGGVWGIAYVLVEPWFPRGAKYWLTALLFGALGPTLVSWFVSSPLHGAPIGGGWHLATLWRGPLLNGAWGIGTAISLWLLGKLAVQKET